jgi:hypothetical protein
VGDERLKLIVDRETRLLSFFLFRNLERRILLFSRNIIYKFPDFLFSARLRRLFPSQTILRLLGIQLYKKEKLVKNTQKQEKNLIIVYKSRGVLLKNNLNNCKIKGGEKINE